MACFITQMLTYCWILQNLLKCRTQYNCWSHWSVMLFLSVTEYFFNAIRPLKNLSASLVCCLLTFCYSYLWSFSREEAVHLCVALRTRSFPMLHLDEGKGHSEYSLHNCCSKIVYLSAELVIWQCFLLCV